MPQITQEQQELLCVATEGVATKLQAFHDGLTADEQIVLEAALRHAAAGAADADEDVSGYAGPAVAVIVPAAVIYLTGKAVSNFVDSLSWGNTGGRPATGQLPPSIEMRPVGLTPVP